MSGNLVKFKEMELMEVDFMGDQIMVVKMKETGKIYAGINWITQAL